MKTFEGPDRRAHYDRRYHCRLCEAIRDIVGAMTLAVSIATMIGVWLHSAHGVSLMFPRQSYEISELESEARQQLIGYLSGTWESPAGVVLTVDLRSEDKWVAIDSTAVGGATEKLEVAKLSSVDSVFGFVRMEVSSRNTGTHELQFNKIFGAAHMITALFDHDADVCHHASFPPDQNAPHCIRAFYWKTDK